MSGKSLPRWPLTLLLAAMVAVPAIFWQRVWFGSHLSAEEIRQRLSRPERPREVQHACEQISKWMERDPEGARQFYDLLPSLADHPDEHVRSAAAWCMGEDGSRYQPFYDALIVLAHDDAPRVRYNAALALARFGDPAARPVLHEMLETFTVPAQWDSPSHKGGVVDILRPQDPVTPLMQLALVDTGHRQRKPILAPLGGRVDKVMARIGAPIAKGEPLCTIAPSPQQVFESLRALAIVGGAEDLESVRQQFDPDSRFSPSERAHLEAQARLTAATIQRREEQ